MDVLRNETATVERVADLITELLRPAAVATTRHYSTTDEEDPSDSEASDDNNKNNNNDSDSHQDGTAIHSHSNSSDCGRKPSSSSSTSTPTERFLQEKLALVLLELASEQDNVRLAANAGKALLEQLSAAQDEAQSVHDQLDWCQQELETKKKENERLCHQVQALEQVISRHEMAWTSNTLVDVNLRRGKNQHHTQNESEDPQQQCGRCAQHIVEMQNLRQTNDVLKRRCLELEVEVEREKNKQLESQQWKAEQDANIQQLRMKYDHALQDTEYLSTQLKQLQQQKHESIVMRDNLHNMIQELQRENDALTHEIGRRDDLLSTLQCDKQALVMQTQVTENRMASLSLANKQIQQTLQELQTQAQTQQVQEYADADLQQHVQDLEQLLEEAQRELAVLQMENQQLLHRSSETPTIARQQRRSRRPTTCSDSYITAADVLLGLDISPVLTEKESHKKKAVMSSTWETSELQDNTDLAVYNSFEVDSLASSDAWTVEQNDDIRRQIAYTRIDPEYDEPPVNHSVDPPRDKDVSPVVGSGSDNIVVPEARNISHQGSLALERDASRHSKAHGLLRSRSSQELHGHESSRSTRSSSSPSIMQTHFCSSDVNSTGTDGSNKQLLEKWKDHIKKLQSIENGSSPKSPLYIGLSVIACATAAGILATTRR